MSGVDKIENFIDYSTIFFCNKSLVKEKQPGDKLNNVPTIFLWE